MFDVTAAVATSLLSVIRLDAFLKSTIDFFSEDGLPAAHEERDGCVNANSEASSSIPT